MSFKDHFSTVAAHYAQSRPRYPEALFDWIATIAPGRGRVWEAGCGSGQATRSLAARFDAVHATDPSSDQIAQAPALERVAFAVEPAEHCSLPDASVDAVCVAQALHWFDRAAFYTECGRVLKAGGVLVAWGYQDVVVPVAVAGVNQALQDDIRDAWPPERADVDAAYAGYAWPFEKLDAPLFEMREDWSLARLLGYFSSYSASKRHQEATGHDPVAQYAPALAVAWGDAQGRQRVAWPLFVHARRKAG